MSDDTSNAHDLATALNMVLEGEDLQDGLSAILMLLVKICEHHEVDVQMVADTLVRSAFERALNEPGVHAEVGEA